MSAILSSMQWSYYLSWLETIGTDVEFLFVEIEPEIII